ncbi:MAG: hypothetical protein U0M51_04340 [Eggerthellaceae bacterium]
MDKNAKAGCLLIIALAYSICTAAAALAAGFGTGSVWIGLAVLAGMGCAGIAVALIAVGGGR